MLVLLAREVMVRQLRTTFKMDVDKSTNFLPHAIHYLNFNFLIGATSTEFVRADSMVFKMAAML